VGDEQAIAVNRASGMVSSDDQEQRESPDPQDTRQPVGVAILAKAPIAGWAKTRLIPLLGAEGAAALQRWLLRRTVANAVAAATGPVTLWCAPEVDHADFACCAQHFAVTLRRQPAGDLGARMLAAVIESPTPAGTLLIGTDCPGLTPTVLHRAAEVLRDAEAVLVPAEDGGYALLGLRRTVPALFVGIEWGSAQVLTQTRQRLGKLHWRWHELATLWDVDRPADFQRLQREFPEVAARGEAGTSSWPDV